jgi:excisionase family DNA binding protein
VSNESHGVDPMSLNSPLLLTINQVAALLNLGRTKTYEIVRSGKIKSLKVGSRRLIRPEDVEIYVKKIAEDQGEDWN